jgi:hypothetical protein
MTSAVRHSLFLLLAALSLCIAPSADAVENRTALWLGAQVDGDLGKDDWSNWLYMAQAQYRTFDAFDGTRQALGRLGLGYRLNRGWRIYGRADYYQTRSPVTGTFNEFRVQQSANWGGPAWGRVNLRFRGMLEQRWIDERDGTAWRFRPRIGLEWPARRFEHVDWMVFSESFFDLRELDWVDRGFNQQRFFFGARIPLGVGLHLEAGYQYQWLNPWGTGDLVNHTLVGMFRFR